MESLRDTCRRLRAQCQIIESAAREMHAHSVFRNGQDFEGQHGEVHANITLAIRHLEYARMRLGKVIQYSGDGVSMYDNTKEVDNG
jgi:hypothetical protein